MSEYILILVLIMPIGGGSTAPSVTSQSILFPSKGACEAAKTAAVDGLNLKTRAICVPRGTGQ